MYERGDKMAEEGLVHVLQLVLLVWESVHIVHHTVYTLVGLEVEVEAFGCGWNLT